MDWIKLVDTNTIAQIKSNSVVKPVVIFKHSTRCSVSGAALGRLERSWDMVEMKDVDYYFLDLISYRPVSQMVAEEFHVEHESPQVLLIVNGECVYNASHLSISYQEIKNQIRKVATKN